MSTTTKSETSAKASENLLLIQALRERLSKLPVQKVAKAYGTAKPTVYFLLNEDRADVVNLEALAKLAAAIKKVEQEQKRKQPSAKEILKALQQ